MGIIFKGPAILLYIVAGLWGLGICFDLVRDALGTIVAVISLFLFPALLGLAPWYAALAKGDWFPLMLVYGGTIGASILFAIGSSFDRNKAE